MPVSAIRARVLIWFALGALTLGSALATALPGSAATGATYTNPLHIQISGDGLVGSCADPTVMHGAAPDTLWYMYCTQDPLNDNDRTATGDLKFHHIPMMSSSDLVNWTYRGDVFPADNSTYPSWAEPTAGLFAPEIDYFNGKYYLYYTVTDVKPAISGEPNCNSDGAIGVATSASPVGPWTDQGSPVVEPRRGGGGCNFFWTFDPDVVHEGPSNYIFYGSYYGGIQARSLVYGTTVTTLPATTVQITIPNRYEGTEVVKHGSDWYLFASAANCCNGPLTGYSLFVGRSTTGPLGPFKDRQGISMLDGRVGGTPVLSMNGNKWVGPGHNTVFTDMAGQDWTIYHAVNREDPYFNKPGGGHDFTKRPALMDQLNWSADGWPNVRNGLWASDSPQPAPAAQPGQTTVPETATPQADNPGTKLGNFSDEFNGSRLNTNQWSWGCRTASGAARPCEPAAGTFGQADGSFNFDSQTGDLYKDSNSASVLTEGTPSSDYMVEVKVKITGLPPDGCCHNYEQAGVVIYHDDDRFVKLVHFSLWETRQTEFAKEVPEDVRYGNTVVGPPGDWTWLRIVKRTQGSLEQYRAYTSNDGTTWVRGGVWTHALGPTASIGLISMASPADQHFTANFDYVHVFALADQEVTPTTAPTAAATAAPTANSGQVALLAQTGGSAMPLALGALLTVGGIGLLSRRRIRRRF